MSNRDVPATPTTVEDRSNWRLPPPAIVLICPPGKNRRTRKGPAPPPASESLSLSSTDPSPSTPTTVVFALNVADVAGPPSPLGPGLPVPATTVTSPPGAMRLTS